MKRAFAYIAFLIWLSPVAEAAPALKPAKEVFDQVQTITLEEVSQELQTQIEQTVTDPFTLEIQRHPFPIEVLSDQPLRLKITDLKINDQQTRFSARVGLEDDEQGPITLSGNIATMTEVPVLKRQLNRDEVITADDLTSLSVPSKKVTRATIVSADTLIGAMPKGVLLKANVPLRESDIKRLRAIAKGSLVSVQVTTPNMALETKGKAMEDGDVGQVIKVSNLDSGRVVQGVVREGKIVDVVMN